MIIFLMEFLERNVLNTKNGVAIQSFQEFRYVPYIYENNAEKMEQRVECL